MPEAVKPFVYFLLHIPRTAGQTVEMHLHDNALGVTWIPRRPSAREALSGARYSQIGTPPLDAICVVSGHNVFGSQEALFPGRRVRRSVLLRDPIDFCVSFYNYRMMIGLSRGLKTPGFELFRETLPNDFMSHFLLNRWLELRWPTLLAMANEEKFARLNAALAKFWFVGAHSDVNELIAGLADDLDVPPVARRRNSTQIWRSRTRWTPLRPEDLPVATRADILARNPLDQALWETWRDAQFATAAVRPKPLPPTPRGAFAAHEAKRPARLLAYQWARSGWRGLSPWRAADPVGLLAAQRAYERGQTQKAMRAYEKVLKTQPCVPEHWISYGHTLRECGYLDKSQTAYHEAIRLAPDEPQGHFYLGCILKSMGRNDDAALAYRQSLACNPTFRHAIQELQTLENAGV
jgi:hypothetical protein